MPKGAAKLCNHSDGSAPLLLFFAALIENSAALINRSLKILNPKLKDECLFLYLHGHKLMDLEREMFSRDVAQIIDLHSNILAPVTSCSSCKIYGMYLYL